MGELTPGASKDQGWENPRLENQDRGGAQEPGMGRPAPGMRSVLGREDLGPERHSRGQHCGRWREGEGSFSTSWNTLCRTSGNFSG